MTENHSLFKQTLLADAHYCAWANGVLVQACSRLAPEELERDLGASHGNLLKTLRHIYYTERVWMRRLVEGALPPMVEVGDQNLFRDPDPEPTLAEMERNWPAIHDELSAWLHAANDEQLAAKLTSRMPDGSVFEVSCAEILLHSVNHSTLHRGQIVTMLRALGHKPPNTDQFSFYLARA